MTICHEQLPPRTPININCLYICGRGTIAAETHGERCLYDNHVTMLIHNQRKILTQKTLAAEHIKHQPIVKYRFYNNKAIF